MTCKRCKFWSRRPTSQKQGDCLEDRPTVVEGGATFWPRTWEHEICGKFQAGPPIFKRESTND